LILQKQLQRAQAPHTESLPSEEPSHKGDGGSARI
jgi:hypothetical protein